MATPPCVSKPFTDDGTVVPLPGFISLDPVLGVPALSYGPLPTLATNGFVGLLVTPGEGLSDVLDFFNHFVYFYSAPLPPETVADLADTPGFFNASGLVSKTIPEVGAEGANGALYVPGVFDPGFASVEFPASYNIISDNAAGRTVPAPSSLTLLATGAGLAGLVRVTWRRHRRT